MKRTLIKFSCYSPDAISLTADRKGFTKARTTIIAAAGLVGMLFVQSCSKAGPNGGDLVTLDNGKTSAEVIANPDTGEEMVLTWNRDLKSRLPIEARPLTLGAEQNSVQLDPHPMPGDPPGYSSQFYGRADWVRGGNVHHGWLSRMGNESERQPLDLNRCWKSGRAHGRMWSEMGGHRDDMHHDGHGMRP